ncbi:hypothetical protein LTR37_002780 [Vermiconidia calcicola]|uniref:Uncharacterized protein n=1 Tax=Vermiconidia calcicola TaxID=1690605 RepID=A0ACC3NS59_9PEZI|nr:hypothetical protein LTR37_002780 [Vermiconidia calcicola]
MVLSQLAEYFYPSTAQPTLNYIDDGRGGTDSKMQTMSGREEEGFQPDTAVSVSPDAAVENEVNYRAPYLHSMFAGGLGGTMGDMLMHSLDTVKTRQQGDPHLPPRYTSMGNTYMTILRQEGVVRGLYGGVAPAFWGSFAGTFMFFGAYEYGKRFMIDHGVAPTMAYLSAGFFADLVISPMYVPTEVLKTRLQLQGRYNNPYFSSGYNYRSTMDALRTIYRTEGAAEFFSGYKATIFRDLPFSALQFAIYEQEQKVAKKWVGPGKDIGLPLEIFTGFSAGGIAGAITCPMDVVKTRIQTELDPEVVAAARQKKQEKKEKKEKKAAASSTAKASTTASRPSLPSANVARQQRQHISTSSPSTTLKRHGHVSLDTESVMKALRIIYRTEGLAGWFRGVGPRFVWTGMQSGTMLVVYQKLLKWFELHPLVDDGRDGLRGVDL